MRYELRLTAYDMLDLVQCRLEVYMTPDDPNEPTVRVLAKTATTRSTGRSEATEWTQEVLATIERALS